MDHHYQLVLAWTGNLGDGTSSYRAYARDFEVSSGATTPVLEGSADPTFFGDRSRYNPEELLVAALSGCHLLSYLHLCSEAGVAVVDYRDRPSGTMAVDREGGGSFTEVVLRPEVRVADEGSVLTAVELHRPAHERCFIASSVNFPVRCEPTVTSSADGRPTGSSGDNG